MCWLGILGVFILLNKSTHSEKYRVSGYSTEWLQANCSMAAPQLSYKNVFFEVNETSRKLPPSDVWIGYLTAKVPFYFHACAVVPNEPTYTVTSIGYCKSVCVNSTLFGIQIGKRQDILNPTSVMNCRCVDTSMDEIVFEVCGGYFCTHDCYAIFSQITVSVNFNHKHEGHDGDCLLFFYPGFEWQACKREDDIKSLCTNSISTESFATAVIENAETNTWIKGNEVCLDAIMYPATVESVNNTSFEIFDQQQYYWTGIVRSNTLLKGHSIRKELLLRAENTYLSDVSYGYLDGNTGKLNFTSNGTKQALCTSEAQRNYTPSTEGHTTIKGVTKSIEGQPTTRYVTQSTEGQIIKDDTNGTLVRSRKWSAIGIGIGVTVAVLVVVIGVIIVFRRRKRHLQLTSHKSTVRMSGYSDCKANGQVTVEKAVSENNFHEKGKPSLSENEHLDRNSTTHDPNVAIVDAVIYHTINDSVEPRENVTSDTNDYDYTTTKVVKTERDPDRVYNKLKLERHGDYDHVKDNCQVHDLPTSNPYDAASVSVKENASLARVNDDYDHVEGKGRIHISATSNDYDMTPSAMTVRAGSASAKNDEGEYNHMSNLPDPTHEESKDVSA